MRSFRQPIAIHANGFGLFSRPSCADRFATDCQRLRPRGSIRLHPLLGTRRSASRASPPPRPPRYEGVPISPARPSARRRAPDSASEPTDRGAPASALSTLDHARLAASGRAGQPAHLRGARDAPAPARRHPGGTLWVDFAVLAAFSARSRQRQPGRTRARFSERAAGGRTETQRLPRPCRRRRVSAPSSPSGYFE